MADVRFHNKFQLVWSDKKLTAAKTPNAVAAVASSQEDKQGKEWNNPYEWLASFNIKGIKQLGRAHLQVLVSVLSVIVMGTSICQLIAPCSRS